ncbi:hypothetical protein [Prochlorococcus sp. MIT 1307]|uniref:hypothetical protein n=1 Tax=Prochlorococcus sp. MIT 1307 TaxID=3096219 RepID=UPI002A7544C1|nr:hypothetical protein [Prochlorococcus sp. MIT 1307]
MHYLYSIAMVILAFTPGALAQSNLLESVKRNPKEAKALCSQFRQLNKKGISASSKEALDQVSRQKNLSIKDAEILSIYVIGLNCPEVN